MRIARAPRLGRGFPSFAVLARTVLSWGVLCAVGAIHPSRADAQLRRESSGIALPSESIAAPDGALAVALDPATIGWLESYGLAYVRADAGAQNTFAGRGDGFFAALPTPLGFGLGAGYQSVRPTTATGDTSRSITSLALSINPSRRVAFGLSGNLFSSADGRFDGVVALDFSAAWRPTTWLGLALLAHDLNAPRLGYTAHQLPRSVALDIGLRPFGRRDFTLDLLAAVDDDGHVGARVGGALRVPYVGRLLAALEVDRLDDSAARNVRVTAGLAVDWGHVGVGGGVLLGDELSDSPGYYVSGRIDGMALRGIPEGRAVAELEIGSLNARSIVRTQLTLDRALHDDRIAGVLIHLRDASLGMAYAQEIRLSIATLRAAGKRVVCSLDAPNGSDLYACAGADRVLLDPAGGVRLVGPSQQVLMLGDTLASLGLRADFVRIGDFKSAPEQLTRNHLSDAGRLADEALLADVYARFVDDFARDRGMSRAAFRTVVDEGPYVADEAIAAHIVDGVADDNRLDDDLRMVFGRDYPLTSMTESRARDRWGQAGRVGVVVIDGDIIDGESLDVPFVGVHMSGGRTVVEAIEGLAADPSVKAIVVRVDSPGGSALASDQVYRALRRAAARKPVVASMGAVAASGGYYVAAACHEIWADPATITGSIGIFYGKVDGRQLAERLGIGVEILTRGRRAGLESIYRPFSPDERAMLADKVRLFYRRFIDRVAEGRAMDPAVVDQVARGRIWSGDAAQSRGLVDRLGGFSAALVRARTLGGLPADAEVVTVPRRPERLLDFVLGSGQASASDDPSQGALPLPDDLRRLAASALLMMQLRADAPLALMPYDISLR